MKRLVAIAAGVVFLWYAGVIIYPLFPTVVKTPKANVVFDKIRITVGLGSLFNRPGSLTKRSVYYRFYENGKWQKEQCLMQPIFENYRATGSFASLTHLRLDENLIFKVYRVFKTRDMEAAKKTKAYAAFSDHMFSHHAGNTKADSLEVSYYVNNNDNTSELLLNFKCTP